MKYMLLVYHERAKFDATVEAEIDKTLEECGLWVDELDAAGKHVFSAGLQSTSTATTVRRDGGEPLITDGPFAETKEYLGGFTIIDARDLNEAIQIASKMPAAKFGSVEVRPVMDPKAEMSDPIDRKVAEALRRVFEGQVLSIDKH
jgi:hypothetical protein